MMPAIAWQTVASPISADAAVGKTIKRVEMRSVQTSIASWETSGDTATTGASQDYSVSTRLYFTDDTYLEF